MGFEIPLINSLAIVFYMVCVAFSLVNYNKTKNYLWILIFGFSLIAILEAVTNVFEWSGVLAELMDMLENLFIFLMYFILIVFAIGFKDITKGGKK